MAAVSLDGTRIVTASEDGPSIVWNLGTGEQVWLIGHKNYVSHASFSPDGRRVVTASFDGTAAVWDSETGERLRELTGHTNLLWQSVFSPDGAVVATVSNDGTARLFDAATGETRAILPGHAEHVFKATFSPDGSLILTGSADRTARLWETATGRQKAVLEGHTGGIGVVRFNADGSRMLTSAALSWVDPDADGQRRNKPSTDRTARIWDAASCQLLFILEHPAPVTAAAFSKTTGTVVTGATDGTIRLWDVATGKNLQTMDLHDHTINSIAFSPDERLIVAATVGARMRSGIWDRNLLRWRDHKPALMAPFVRAAAPTRRLRPPQGPVLSVGAKSARRSRGCGKARPSRRLLSGPAAGTTTRAGPATRRRASPGCGRGRGRGTRRSEIA
jgi:WD40 repeat protein